MKLLVLGASSELGQEVVSLASRRGLDVTAHVTNAPSAAPPEGVTYVEGFLLDTGVLAGWLPGHSAIINTVGPRRFSFQKPFRQAGSKEDARFALDVTHALISAMKATGPSRVIALSAAGAGDSLSRASWAFRAISRLSRLRQGLQSFTQIESAWAESGLDWVAVRASRFRSGRLTRRAQPVPTVQWSHSLSRPDLAAYMLNLLELKAFSDRTPLIAGP